MQRVAPAGERRKPEKSAMSKTIPAGLPAPDSAGKYAEYEVDLEVEQNKISVCFTLVLFSCTSVVCLRGE